MEDRKAIILFDGICRLCNGVVGFLIRKDKKNIFEYVSIQSKTGKRLQAENNITDIDSVALIYNHNTYILSDTIIQISKLLSPPWCYFRHLRIIPKKWRDYLYKVVANNRYRWFGKLDSCETTFN